MDSWKRIMPEYQIICWDMNRFNIHTVAFVDEACSKRKWAFASDYIRLYALYTEGGIYLDSDVIVKKKFDDFLTFDFFTSLEYHSSYVAEKNTISLLNPDGTSKQKYTRKPGIGLQAAVLGGVRSHPFLISCLKWYENRHFVQEDGDILNNLIAPDIYAMIAEDYGFKYKDIQQKLTNNMLILSSDVFAGNMGEATENSYAIHCCEGSWHNVKKETLINKCMATVKKNSLIRKIFGKNAT
jgi:hypothetical protein